MQLEMQLSNRMVSVVVDEGDFRQHRLQDRPLWPKRGDFSTLSWLFLVTVYCTCNRVSNIYMKSMDIRDSGLDQVRQDTKTHIAQ